MATQGLTPEEIERKAMELVTELCHSQGKLAYFPLEKGWEEILSIPARLSQLKNN